MRLLCAASLVLATGAAQAQAIRCSAFLHNADGSWRSFEAATVVGSYGPVKVEAGEIFKRGAARDKADIAVILESLCG